MATPHRESVADWVGIPEIALSTHAFDTDLTPHFRETLAEKTDEQLFAMLAAREDYLPAAIEAAPAAIRRRNLSPERAAQVQSVVEARRVDAARIAALPSPGGWRSLNVWFGLGPELFLAICYQAIGHSRKSSEAWTWLLYIYLAGLGLAALGAMPMVVIGLQSICPADLDAAMSAPLLQRQQPRRQP